MELSINHNRPEYGLFFEAYSKSSEWNVCVDSLNHIEFTSSIWLMVKYSVDLHHVSTWAYAWISPDTETNAKHAIFHPLPIDKWSSILFTLNGFSVRWPIDISLTFDFSV